MPRRSRSRLDWTNEADRAGLKLSLTEGHSERVDDTAESETGATNKENNTPMNTRSITSELGCVTPIVVVPGDWTDKEMYRTD